MTKDIALIYNPNNLDPRGNRVIAFCYPDPGEIEARTKGTTKSRALGTIAMKGDPIHEGLNWIDEEQLAFIRKSEKGATWEAVGALKILSKRKLKDAKDSYNGTLLDYKREAGDPLEFVDIKTIIANTWSKTDLSNIKSQAPGMFEGAGIGIVTKACDDQIKRIEAQYGLAVDASRHYGLQTA
jgi:hypothetical protein